MSSVIKARSGPKAKTGVFVSLESHSDTGFRDEQALRRASAEQMKMSPKEYRERFRHWRINKESGSPARYPPADFLDFPKMT